LLLNLFFLGGKVFSKQKCLVNCPPLPLRHTL